MIGISITFLAVSTMAWEAFTFPDGIMNAEANGNVTFNAGGDLFMVGRVQEGETWHSVFHRSQDHGGTFTEMGRAAMPYCRGMVFSGDGTAYLAAFDSFTEGVGIYRSRDTCRTWESVRTGAFWSLCVTAGGAVYALGAVEADTGVHRSTDGGDNWDLHFEFSTGGAGGGKIYCFNDNDLYILNSSDKTLYYSDNGAAWTAVAEEPSWYVRSFADLQSFGPRELVVECNNTMHHSSDNGATWSEISLPRPPRSYAVVDSERLLLGAVPESETSCMMFLSENNGSDWEEYDDGIPSEVYIMRTVTVSPDGYAYAFPLVWTGENTTGYRQYMGPSTAVAPMRAVAESGASVQTQIDCANMVRVTAGAPIGTVTVSDLRGRLVRAVQGNGMQSVRFNTSSLPAGAYTMGIVTARNAHMRRLIISR